MPIFPFRIDDIKGESAPSTGGGQHGPITLTKEWGPATPQPPSDAAGADTFVFAPSEPDPETAALLLPAVNAAREAARRSQCADEGEVSAIDALLVINQLNTAAESDHGDMAL